MSFSGKCNPAGVEVGQLFSSNLHTGKMVLNADHKTRTQNPITTGTSVLGIKFNGGVALAADMLGSYGSLARYPGISRMCHYLHRIFHVLN